MRKMKKIIAIILTLALCCCSIVGCSKSSSSNSSGSAPTSATSKKKVLKIGFSFAVMDEGMTLLYNNMKQVMDNDYPQYKIEYSMTNANVSVSKQLSDIDDLINKQPDLIYVMAADSDGIAPGIESIKKAGIKSEVTPKS